MARPKFAKYKSSQNYTDYIVVSVVLHVSKESTDESHFTESIDRYIISHYKILNGEPYKTEEFVEMHSDNFLEDLLQYFKMGTKVCILINNFAPFINLSGLTEYLERNSYRVSMFDVINYDNRINKEESITVSAFACSGPPNYIQIESTMFTSKICILDIANFISGSQSNISKMFNNIPEYGEFILGVDSGPESIEYINHWKYNYIFCSIKAVFSDLGINSLPNTPASGCMRYFRTLQDSQKIVCHTDTELAEFELKSYSFGRTDVLFDGEYYGKCYLLDIQSMYPMVCCHDLLPYEVVNYGTGITIEEISNKLGKNKWIVRALVETDEPAYLQYDSVFHRFPTGRFITTLAGREVDYAITAGHVKQVIYAAEYNTDYILQEFATKLINMRYNYRQTGERSKENIMKTIINSIWGKWAAPGNVWEHLREEFSEYMYNCYRVTDSETGAEELYRVVNGDVFKMNKRLLSDNCFPAISATIAGLGRSWIYYLISVAGLENILYSCVDGIIVTEDGLERLQRYVDSTNEGFGYLKISEEDDKCKILGYGKYRIGKKKVLIGYNPAEKKIYEGWHNRRQNPLGKAGNTIKEINSTVININKDVIDNTELDFVNVFGQRIGFPYSCSDYGNHKIDYYFLDQMYLNFE